MALRGGIQRGGCGGSGFKNEQKRGKKGEPWAVVVKEPQVVLGL